MSKLKWRIGLTILAALLIGIIGAGGYVAYAYQGKALPRTEVAGIDASGMTREQLTEALNQRVAQTQIDWEFDGYQTRTDLAGVGVTVDVPATVDAAFAPAGNVWKRITGIFSAHRITPVTSRDDAKLEQFLTDSLEETGTAVKEPTVVWSDAEQQFVTTPGSDGIGVDPDEVDQALSEASTDLKELDVKLTPVPQHPHRSDDSARQAAASANQLVGLNVTIADGANEITAAPADKAKWIKIEPQDSGFAAPSIDKAKLSQWVQTTGESTNVDPVPGIKNVDANGKPLVVASDGTPGWKVNNVPAVTDALYSAFSSGQSYSGAFDHDKVEQTFTTRPVAPGAENLPYPAAEGEKWIDINLTTAQMTAYEGAKVVRGPIPVVPGKPTTPTVDGLFHVYLKYESQTMTGLNEDGSRYVAPDVPWVSYFHGSYSIHAAPWQRTFGWTGPGGSHGCVNTPTEDAKWIYNWAGLGTVVLSHY